MTAIINGVLAPPLVLIIVLLTSDRTVDSVNPRVLARLGWATCGTMITAAFGLLLGR